MRPRKLVWMVLCVAGCAVGSPSYDGGAGDLRSASDLQGAGDLGGAGDLAGVDLAKQIDLATTGDLAGRDFAGRDLANPDLATTPPDGGSTLPMVSGLMMRSGVPPTATENFITSSVLAINWTDIELSPGAYDFTLFDNRLTGLAQANVTSVKVRVFGGPTAPPWIKRLGSTPGYYNSIYITGAQDCSPAAGANWGGVSMQNGNGTTACIPFFWTSQYQAAYDALMKALAARLDASPTKYAAVNTIVDSSCMAVYAEVFYRGQADGPSNHTLLDAGLTQANDWACQAAAIQTHANYFKGKRRTALAINDWDVVSATGGNYRVAAWNQVKQGIAVPGTYDFLKAVAEPSLGAELELQNNGLHTTSACGSTDPTSSYFCYLKYYPYRHGFQTQTYVPCSATAGTCSTSNASKTLLDDLNNGIAMRAQFIELPNGMSNIDWSLMACFHDDVANGKTTSCPQ